MLREASPPIMNTAGSVAIFGLNLDQHYRVNANKGLRHSNPFRMHILLSPLAVPANCPAAWCRLARGHVRWNRGVQSPNTAVSPLRGPGQDRKR